MASVTLSQSSEYRLAHPEQDWSGWQVFDTAGNPIGRVTDVIIDTEESKAVAVVLDTGGEVPVDDMIVGDRSLVAWTDAASASAAPPPTEASSLQLFQQGTLDVVEHVEVAVMKKRPVVIEELLITRDIVEQKVRIQTTLRRCDVDVETLPATGAQRRRM